jgi:hypothetical protein
MEAPAGDALRPTPATVRNSSRAPTAKNRGLKLTLNSSGEINLDLYFLWVSRSSTRASSSRARCARLRPTPARTASSANFGGSSARASAPGAAAAGNGSRREFYCNGDCAGDDEDGHGRDVSHRSRDVPMRVCGGELRRGTGSLARGGEASGGCHASRRGSSRPVAPPGQS